MEALLTQHPWIDEAVCFPVPSQIYGEEVGCALVLAPVIAHRVTLLTLLGEIRPWVWPPISIPAFGGWSGGKNYPEPPATSMGARAPASDFSGAICQAGASP